MLARWSEGRLSTDPEPPEAFARHFGEQHGVDLPPPDRRGYKPLSFSREDEE